MDLATPLIPDGVYKIRNVQSGLVVDLVDGKQDGRIAGAFDGHSNKHTKVCVIRSGGRYSLLQ